MKDIAVQSAQYLGTGFSNTDNFRTTKTIFDKRDTKHPDAILALYYDSARGLERRRIICR